ncbi:MAG TPA: hypothetical protein VJO34_06470 [Methylomirabilota bacterium]|nr:hypothetical protein [Methylomirabilota bacterium]
MLGGPCRLKAGRSSAGERGLSRLWVALLLFALASAMLALFGAFLYDYFRATTTAYETLREDKPISRARVAADQESLAQIRMKLHLYYNQYRRWPRDRAALAKILIPAPSFQCDGNDYDYDPRTGTVRLLIEDPSRC